MLELELYALNLVEVVDCMPKRIAKLSNLFEGTECERKRGARAIVGSDWYYSKSDKFFMMMHTHYPKFHTILVIPTAQNAIQ